MTTFPPIDVSVTHGDLRRSQYPFAVGHYVGDVMVNAEATLDEALDGVLRQRFNLGIYPGDLLTSEIVRQPLGSPPGAIVIGLGKIGELTSDRLRRTFATALRRHALTVLESTPANEDKPRSAAFSCVLVGTDGGALGAVADSIHAILRGALDANRALRESGLLERVRIDAVEFVEFYEDVAIRAAQFVAALPGPLEQELGPGEAIVGADTLASKQGGRFLRPPTPYASGWWQRIAVQRKPSESGTAAPASDATTALQFTVLTDRARLEQELSVGQRGLIQQLIARATESPKVDLEVLTALYQLIVPDQVKDRISFGGDLLFMVDRAGAGYPFELMAERRTSGPRPLAVERGVLRQFETAIFRQRVDMARANAMFVVGNPKTFLWPDLQGAELEARDVADVAEKFGLSVVRAPRTDPETTIVKLMTGEYRILHLAAHGQFDADPMKSGVIVGDKTFITPAEILRLPLVPELVFLNCCYLGTMGEARASGPDPRLAASLAEGFIQAGVRAVVAAGLGSGRHRGPHLRDDVLQQLPEWSIVRRLRPDRSRPDPSGSCRRQYLGRLPVLRQSGLPLLARVRARGTEALGRAHRRTHRGAAGAAFAGRRRPPGADRRRRALCGPLHCARRRASKAVGTGRRDTDRVRRDRGRNRRLRQRDRLLPPCADGARRRTDDRRGAAGKPARARRCEPRHQGSREPWPKPGTT